MSSQQTFLTDMENWANVYMFRSLSQYFEYLKTTEVSMPQAYVLTYIHYNGPSNISDICAHMMVSAAAASQMVDRLEKLDLVERSADPGDRRVRNVVLSRQGENFVEQSIKARRSWIKQLPADLCEGELDQISAALKLLTAIYQA